MKATKAILLLLAIVITTLWGCQPESKQEMASIKNVMASQQQVEEHQQLAYALGMALEDHPDVLELIYTEALRCPDEYYFVTFADVFAKSMDQLSVDFEGAMNAELAAISNLGDNPVTDILNDWLQNGSPAPQIVLPYLGYAFPNGEMTGIPTSGIYSAPHFGYKADGTGYPLGVLEFLPDGGFSTSEIDKVTAKLVGALVVASYWVHPCLIDGADCAKTIVNCWPQSLMCRTCPSVSSPAVLPVSTGGGSSMSHEIQIDLGTTGGTGSLLGNWYNIMLPSGSLVNNGWYGKLSNETDIPTYKLLLGTSTNSVQRINNVTGGPIKDNASGMEGFSITLCEMSTRFNQFGSSGNSQLAQGGVYRISQPGTYKEPLLFAFPFGKYLYYEQGPDMWLQYYSNASSSACTYMPYYYAKVEEQYSLSHCEFCSPLTHPIYPAGVLASTNATAIRNYWKDNAVIFGVCDANMARPANVMEIMAPASGTSEPLHGALWAELKRTSTSPYTFEVLKEGLASIPPQMLRVHVYATFEGSTEVIDNWYNLDLDSVDPEYSAVTASFRGKLDRFNIKFYLEA